MTDDNIIYNTGDQHIFGERFEDHHPLSVSDGMFTELKRYIGGDIGTVYLQENCEVTIVLGKGSKIHIVNEEEKE